MLAGRLREERGGLVDRLPRGHAVLVEPCLPPVGDPESFAAVRTDDRPDDAHEPGGAVGQVYLPGRAVDGIVLAGSGNQPLRDAAVPCRESFI